MTSIYRLRSQAAQCVGEKDYQGAIEYWLKVLEREPQDLATHIMVAQCYEWMEQFSESLNAARRILNVEPTNPFCLRLAARASAELGEHDQARTYVEQSLMYPVQYSATHTRLLDVMSAMLKAASFIPLLKRMHHGLIRERVQCARRDLEWNDWARKYLDWYHSTLDGKI